jgi:hypothetical protein
MVDFIITAYLATPVVLGLILVSYFLLREPDKIRLATVVLFAISLGYFAQAFEFSKQDVSLRVNGILLGAYALGLYICMAALAIYFKRWAWKVTIGALGVHIILILVAAPGLISQGTKGLLTVLGSVLFAAVGLWAAFHKGSRNLVSKPPAGGA